MSTGVSITLASDGVLEIVLQRSEAGNALTFEMTAEIERTVRALPQGTRLVLMRAEGEDFCTGRQSPMPPADSRPTVSEIRGRVAEPVLDFYAAIRDIPVPVISVIRGRALGVGCALAGLADLAIADHSARFGIPEMDRDIPPLLVMTALSDRLSRAAIARLVLTRDAVDAEEAVRMGLVGWVLPGERIEEEVDRIRAALAGNTGPVLRAVKGFLRAYPEMSGAARRELAASLNSAAVSERFHK